MKVSVIIPVYNSGKYLDQCMESILSQTLSDIEVICVNDGSMDNSLEILNAYAGKDSRVTVINQENANAGAARNRGMQICRGEYLSILDSDDFFEPDMLEKAYCSAKEFDSEVVVMDSDRYLDEAGTFAPQHDSIKKDVLPPYNPFSRRAVPGNIFKMFIGWPWDKLFSHQFIKDNNIVFQEQRTTNDLLFVYTALVLARRISVVNEVLIHQRRRLNGSLSVTREKSWMCFHYALDALKKRLQSENIFWELEQDYVNYALHFSLWNYDTLSEPVKSRLGEKLAQELFQDYGITYRTETYFYDVYEYRKYLEIMRRFQQ